MRWDSLKINRWTLISGAHTVIGNVRSYSHDQPTDVYVHAAYAIIGTRL